ncbi:glyoxalase family protein [Ectocarpus siliculosus]|uniref:Glyoxalase family protein n=1 Tax=Ectocarpus siliculosus TaxID=2880 RepID=D8LJ98_ECTSI|nr:glyoxalase family protein [Ectocarpus siliculosus]|eukprot:CBN76982.1 glyoxalase family protein [Ectocarpus siliculosus]
MSAMTESATPACPSDGRKHPPTRRGIIVNVMVESADKFVDFMGKTTKAKEYFRFPDEDGKIMHLAIDVGGVALYVEELGNKMDTGAISTPHARLHLNTDDPIGVGAKLVEHGAKELTKMAEQFWGATFGVYQDPFGQIWSVSNSTNTIEDVPKELARKVIPFILVRDCPAYMTFLTDALGAEAVSPPDKAPTGKIMCAQMKINGGIIMVADQCDEDSAEAAMTISYEIGKDEAAPLAKSFTDNGGEVLQPVSMQFWGQVWGRCKDPFGQPWGLCEVQEGPAPSKEDMAKDMEMGAKYDWRYTWVVEDMPTVYCYGAMSTSAANTPAISEETKKTLPAAFAGAAAAGLAMAAPPASAYYTWDPSPGGTTKFTCGPSVAGGGASALMKDVNGDDNGLGVRTAGGCKCVTTLHTGPYDELKKCYEATFEWVEAKGYESRMPVFELYENDPKDTPPEKLKTKVCIPIVAKGTPKA